MTKAIILSLGMLQEEVNTNRFIVYLLAKAKASNPGFNFTPDLQTQAYALSDRFNAGKVSPEDFKRGLLTLFTIPEAEITDTTFWEKWDAMVTVGNIKDKMQLLQDFSSDHQSLIYLHSDTNTVHLEKLKTEYQAQSITLNTDTSPPQVEQFPLYASCLAGKSRFELVQHIIAEIKQKQFNHPDEIILILADPENIQNPHDKANQKKKIASIIEWCSQQENVSVKLHSSKDSLLTTLQKAAGAKTALTPAAQI